MAASAYEHALAALYRAPLPEFIVLRDRLAAELRARGDRPAAGRLTMRRRPTISAWTVNQLYWQARAEFDDMLAAAKRVRAGKPDAISDYRRAIATLRQRSVDILKKAGHHADSDVLGRVANTLAAIGAAGFAPDLPGTVAVDRDPPGFDVASAHAGRPRATVIRERRATMQEEKRRAAAAARQARERERIERELGAARAEVEQREKDLGRRRSDLRAAERAVERARERVEHLERSAVKSS